MSKSMIPPGLVHFSRLNSSVWFHEPSATTLSNNLEPDLVLIVGWMDATPRHISKYTAGYEELYPSARILTITTTTIDTGFRSEAANRKRIAPIMEIFYTLPPNAKVLLHFFSNGGAIVSAVIAKAYREKVGKTLPVTASIMDSGPGRASLAATTRAMAVALPKNILLKWIGILLLRFFYLIYALRIRLVGKVDLIEQTRRQLNDKELFDTDAPRMYIYSETDNMVGWQDLVEHGEDAQKLGYTVSREKFLNSGHVGHLLVDPERYWGIVQNLWKTAS